MKREEKQKENPAGYAMEGRQCERKYRRREKDNKTGKKLKEIQEDTLGKVDRVKGNIGEEKKTLKQGRNRWKIKQDALGKIDRVKGN